MSQQSPVFVVTGGAGGIGRACAHLVGTHGLLLLNDVVAEPLEQVAKQLRAEGLHVETQCGDISNEGPLRQLAERARALGTFRGMIHTAGLSPSMANWQRIMEVDLVGTARLLEAFLPLAEPHTAVVCIASMAGHLAGTPLEAFLSTLGEALDHPLREDMLQRLGAMITAVPSTEQSGLAYALAKYGVRRLCQREAAVWGARGARLVSLSPGIIETPMGQQELDKQEAMPALLAQTPLKRIGSPQEIASAVEFLLSANASFITGCDLLVDGGITGMIQARGAQARQPYRE